MPGFGSYLNRAALTAYLLRRLANPSILSSAYDAPVRVVLRTEEDMDKSKSSLPLGVAQGLFPSEEVYLEFLSSIPENSPVAIAAHDPKGNIIYVNPYFTDLYGYAPEDVLGRSHKILVAEGSIVDLDEVYATIVDQGFWRGEDWRRKKDGTIFPSSTSVTKVRGRDGAIIGYSDVSRDISERRAMERRLLEGEEQLRHLATTDPLTGCYNRRRFLEYASEEAYRVRRYGRNLSLAIMDLDNFKQVNDRYGHPAGDAVLMMLARVSLETLRESDVFARFGGDEFVVVMPESDSAVAVDVAERIRVRVGAEEVTMGQDRFTVSLSIGVATMASENDGVEDLLKRADAALYRAKSAGRDRVER
jgi:two-component system, cell cycle response regulator